ncbi:cobalt-precorrin-6A reductase [Allorhizobium sp. BGMRC 0089]|uniref:cobalt-precorrin-6A reductase n=1 Tax=Allorhizobium sonneratiae TaxID=2934936 RepID=UPI0020337A1B|nr:cobalt-precorrin-6A reductase [Allorhizobium sonneratiae]MCM2292225.1 cobalt-precorrin-6A reductase [Allorhizobium sonneratiae]
MPGPVRRILILGGTAEAAALAIRLVAEGEAEIITALAGRTAHPADLPGRVRMGGFGGVEGLTAYLIREGIEAVYDATHPFARNISRNAAIACQNAGIPLTVLTRPAWRAVEDDQWQSVADEAEAAAALPHKARVFLALGRQHIAPFAARNDCFFLIRMVDPPAHALPFADHALIIGKATADTEAECQLLADHAITHIVCRNSGGSAGYGKISAARHLGLPVIMIDR